MIGIRHSACMALRILCIALPIVVALTALTLIISFDDDRNVVQTAGVAGATEPTEN
jgi:hypothetical protein